MHILFLSHYFRPESNAPASRVYEHCLRWVRAGHEVTVVTSVPNVPDGVAYPGYKNRFHAQTQFVDGIRVIRVWTYLAPNAGTVKRIANFLSYMVSASLESLHARRPDVVVATTPQFFCGLAGVIVSRMCRAPLVLEVRDIWPESIGTVGAINNKLVLTMLERLERWMYQAACHIVTVGSGYRKLILRRAPEVDDRISIITNGVDLDQYMPAAPDLEWRRELGFENKFVCSYVGTIGMSHGLEVVIDAANLLRASGRSDIAFCFAGDGAERSHLETRVKSLHLEDSVVFTGRQDKTEIPRILASSDVALIHVKSDEYFESVIPSKLFETMAMQRPIILGVKGEARSIAMDAGVAILMEPCNSHSLVDALVRLADDPQLVKRLSVGSQGRSHVREKFNREVLAKRYLNTLEFVRSSKPNRLATSQPAWPKAA